MTQTSVKDKPLALIIEDDQKIATIFAHALQSVNYETEIVGDGEIALTWLAQIIPAIVILDLHLPYVSGKDILGKIRADKRLVDTQVMIVTADSILAEGLVDDADLVLLKPISFNQLRELAVRRRPDNRTTDYWVEQDAILFKGDETSWQLVLQISSCIKYW